MGKMRVGHSESCLRLHTQRNAMTTGTRSEVLCSKPVLYSQTGQRVDEVIGTEKEITRKKS